MAETSGTIEASPSPSRFMPALALAVCLVLVAFAVYFPAINGEFLWEDSTWLGDSATTRAPDGIIRCWQFWSSDNPDYWPLTASVFWIEYRLFGDDPTGYHLVTIALHALGAIGLWRVLLRLGVPCAWLISLIFIVHPVCVLSVAWITELKNTLSVVFYMLAIGLYLRFEDSSKWTWYIAAILAFFLALAAKTSTIALPAVLLGIAWWRRSRIQLRDVLRTIPFFLLSGLFAYTTVAFQYDKAIGTTIRELPQSLSERFCIAGRAVWFYLRTSALPIDLSIIYPRWDLAQPRLLAFIPPILVIAALIVLLLYRKTWARPILAALGYVLIVLLPVLGFFNMSFMLTSFVSDHFQYMAVPAVVALIVAAGWRVFSGSRPLRLAGISVAVVCVALLAFATWSRAKAFKSDEALWNHTLDTNPGSWDAQMNLGSIYDQRGDPQKAIKHYTRAIGLKSNYARAYSNRATVYKNGGLYFASQGNTDQAQRFYAMAIADHTKAIDLKPYLPGAWSNRGVTYYITGRFDQAMTDFTEAIRLSPDEPRFYQHRCLVWLQLGKTQQALADISKAIHVQPDYAKAYELRGVILGQGGQYEKAFQDFDKAASLDPTRATSLSKTKQSLMEARDRE